MQSDNHVANNQAAAAPQALKKRWYKKWQFYLILGLILIVLVLLLSFIGYNFGRGASKINLVGDTQVADEALYLHAADDPSWGEPDAKIKIVEFSDFECPFCQASFPVVRDLLFNYMDDIYLVYRDFPDFLNHPYAEKAAEAANCAQEQEKFWPMHDKLFVNQANLNLEDLKRYALEIGLDVEAFSQCLDSGKYYAEIQQDYQDGVALGAIGTPTFFINGYRVSGSIPREIFFNIADTILAAAAGD